MPGLDVKEVLAELAERIAAECDYELEAAGHRRLARFWARPPLRQAFRRSTRRSAAAGCWSANGSTGTPFDEVVGERGRGSATATPRSSTGFFYANAGELDLALGDPHPGNYLLMEDGHVAFFDFGMIREMPRGYLAREAEVFAALRESDAPALVRPCASWVPARPVGRVERGDVARADARGAGWWFLSRTSRAVSSPKDLWAAGTEARCARRAATRPLISSGG
jgi:hypothetical protein